VKPSRNKTHQYIQEGVDNLMPDVDSNVTVFRDGLMVIRKLFGFAFAGDILIDKAMSPDSIYYEQDDAAVMFAQNIDALNTLG
tara:strand:+ start:399 stop:647 length:249 start_codon:yes stop_codon:yes gene_type:complete